MALPTRLIRQPRIFARAFTTPSIPSSSTSASTSSIPAEHIASSSSARASSASSTSLRYRIPRTENGELPVYTKLRRGNMWKTIVRNVEGDVGALQTELNTLFQQTHIDPLRPAPTVSMRPTNRHLEVRGRWVREVKEWMEGKGF